MREKSPPPPMNEEPPPPPPPPPHVSTIAVLNPQTGIVGALSISNSDLQWKPSATAPPALEIPLGGISRTPLPFAQQEQLTPFQRGVVLHVRHRDGSKFDFPIWGHTNLTVAQLEAEAFATALTVAVAAVKAAPPVTTTVPTGASATAASPLGPLVLEARAKRRTTIRLSKCVAAGRELYRKLHEVGRLSHDHKQKAAA
eukprot:827163-Prymnesium_polylepis.1